MRLLKPFLTMAQEAGLQSALPVDPVAPTFSVPAGDYGFIISGMRGLQADESDASVSLGFGLSHSNPDLIANLALKYDYQMEVWKLEYDLRGDDPPPEVRVIAERFGLVNPEENVAIVDDTQLTEIVKAMIAFIVTERERIARQPIRSSIPIGELIAGGGRLP